MHTQHSRQESITTSGMFVCVCVARFVFACRSHLERHERAHILRCVSVFVCMMSVRVAARSSYAHNGSSSSTIKCQAHILRNRERGVYTICVCDNALISDLITRANIKRVSRRVVSAISVQSNAFMHNLSSNKVVVYGLRLTQFNIFKNARMFVMFQLCLRSGFVVYGSLSWLCRIFTLDKFRKILRISVWRFRIVKIVRSI